MAADRILNTSMVRDVPLGPLLTWEDVERIRCPVLSVLGRYGYQSEDLEALTSLLPRGELHVFDGQGHSVLVERHREVRELVLSWIARQAP
jgi:pimeloyl-ACP methyl ester carboxylesterase